MPLVLAKQREHKLLNQSIWRYSPGLSNPPFCLSSNSMGYGTREFNVAGFGQARVTQTSINQYGAIALASPILSSLCHLTNYMGYGIRRSNAASALGIRHTRT